MNKKTLLALLLASTFVFSACDKTDNPDGPDTPDTHEYIDSNHDHYCDICFEKTYYSY